MEHHHSPTYRETRQDNPCAFSHASSEDQPCWGRVLPVDSIECEDDESFAIWACKGHEGLAFGDTYERELT